MNTATILALALAAGQECQYAVNYGIHAYKLTDGSWSEIQQGSFVEPGLPVRFRGWVSVGPNGCDACCAKISFRYAGTQGACQPPWIYDEWIEVGEMKPLSPGEMWEWISPTYIPQTYVVLGYFLISHVQSAGQTHTHAPSRGFFVPCTGDVTGDLNVNVNDLLAVINNWFPTNSCGDANNDGTINATDIMIIVGNRGSCY